MGSHDDALSPSLSTKVREEGEGITLGIYSRRASIPLRVVPQKQGTPPPDSSYTQTNNGYDDSMREALGGFGASGACLSSL